MFTAIQGRLPKRSEVYVGVDKTVSFSNEPKEVKMLFPGYKSYTSGLSPSTVLLTFDNDVSTGYVNVSPRGKRYEVRL